MSHRFEPIMPCLKANRLLWVKYDIIVNSMAVTYLAHFEDQKLRLTTSFLAPSLRIIL